MMTARVIMVELMTITKALPGDTDYHLFISLSIKASACSRMYFSFGYLWLLTIPSEDQKNDGQATPMNMSYTGYNTVICLGEGTTTKGQRRLELHKLEFCCPTMQTLSVG